MYTARFACGYLATVSNAATALGPGLHVCMSTVAEGGSVESKSADANCIKLTRFIKEKGPTIRNSNR